MSQMAAIGWSGAQCRLSLDHGASCNAIGLTLTAGTEHSVQSAALQAGHGRRGTMRAVRVDARWGLCRAFVPAWLLRPAHGAAYVPIVEIPEIPRRGGRRHACPQSRAGAGAAPNGVRRGDACAVCR
ncbi:hypothetical protein XAP412_250038 [Xanthomonas phaseoli pv. phaseoli]|uniref:Uncharacterized protein n=1 Tax=Xanthomonas campestris pv. phaseoli TaxID=317013 RepID=A0AB38DY35_XANCH|nr:hypothetical protein XAP6984_310123 [Xanthomonas phaseoli pv. phaseoli]SON82406.1 hypothetical protein XAP412_250038 [Xanthomonas phaseoli pv. phaseoli]SON86499.1 hypothetical protein XAP7430_260121 [Xanthomonas phaseoli pv. phaseoli]SOO26941.1 hypothetical protein XAP6164_1030020 [Xanthomonas phaseoli pv. phaseoli]